MRFPPGLIRCVLLVVTTVLGTATLSARMESGSVVGHVLDGEGRPVAGATITLHGLSALWSQTSQVDGWFGFPAVIPGTFAVEVSSPSTGTVILSEVPVLAGRTTPLEITLDRPPDETATLIREATLLDPWSFDRASVLTSTELEGVPMPDRPELSASRVAGTAGERLDENGFEPAFAITGEGASPRQTEWMLDGVDVTDAVRSGLPLLLPGVNDLQQERITAAPFDSALASPGAVVSMFTSSAGEGLAGEVDLNAAGGSGGDEPEDPVNEPYSASSRITRVTEARVAGGGAIREGRLWIWAVASMARVDVDRAGEQALVDRERDREFGLVRVDDAIGRRSFARIMLVRERSEWSCSESQTCDRSGTLAALFAERQISERVHANLALDHLEAKIESVPSGLERRSEPGVDGARTALHFSIPSHSNHLLTIGTGLRDYRVGGCDSPAACAPEPTAERLRYEELFVQDRFSFRNLYVEAGARLDRQRADSVGLGEPGDAEIDWSTISPRVGVTWLLPGETPTVLRVSRARYAERLGMGGIFESRYTDELPRLPLRVAEDFEAPRVDELAFEWEREIATGVLLGAAWRHRTFRNPVRVGLAPQSGEYGPGDFIQTGTLTGELPAGSAYTAPIFALRPGAPPTAAVTIENDDASVRRLDELDLHAIRRISSGLYIRGFATWRNLRQQVQMSELVDPTPRLGMNGCTTCGGSVVFGTDDPSTGAWFGGRWAAGAMGLLQLPSGYGFSAVVLGRDGPRLPWFVEEPASGRVVVARGTRLPDFWQTDLRVARTLSWERLDLVLSLDLFNVADRRTVTRRNVRLGFPDSGAVVERQNPRLFRLGVGLRF